MIINVRGTGGSGKSTLVRQVMARYPHVEPEFILGRKRPIGYVCARAGFPDLYVIGSYETPTGGCDTIGTPAQAFAIVDERARQGDDVLFEGIIVQDSLRRLIELNQAHAGVVVVFLNVPLDVCLASIATRRIERGTVKALNPRNTTNRARTVERSMAKIAAAGITNHWAGREEALAICLDVLGFAPDAPPVPQQQETEFRLQ